MTETIASSSKLVIMMAIGMLSSKDGINEMKMVTAAASTQRAKCRGKFRNALLNCRQGVTHFTMRICRNAVALHLKSSVCALRPPNTTGL